jgi:esterase
MENSMINGFTQVGHGPHKVMVMGGWFGDAADWQATVDAIDPAAFTFVLFDYRGYGRSRDIEGAYNFEQSAQDALALADQLGWQRFSLIGHSMGGVAIQRVLLAAPDRIDRMLAISAVPACSSRMDAQRLQMFDSAVLDVAKREFIINYSTGSRLTPTWVQSMARRSMEGSRQDAFAGYLKEWATNDFSALVQGNEVKLKVMVGEFDPTIGAALMESTWLAWYPNAQMEVLANCGHYPMHETPPALAAAIQSFLQQP